MGFGLRFLKSRLESTCRSLSSRDKYMKFFNSGVAASFGIVNFWALI